MLRSFSDGLDAAASDSTAVAPVWQPNPDHEDGRPNTQRLAYECTADVVGMSGSAGWGKTDCLLGLAANKHKKSVIFRRVFKNLRSTIERSRQVFNPGGDDHKDDRFNESLHRWVLDGGRKMLEFEACQYERNKFDQRGRDRDLMCFDEATEFPRSVIEFISGWNRSPDPDQLCQVVLAFNVPTDNAGSWVIDYFMPWIAYLFPYKYTHPNPAKPGEFRYYATIKGEEVECESGEPFEHDGERIIPTSRTFFFGTLEDNPYYDDQYIARLQSQPEPIRSQLLYGNFAAETKADPWQVIPTAWVKEAQRRWMEREEPDMPVSGVGVDLVRGGRDNFALSKRKGTWFAEIVKIPGVNVEDGPAAAGLVHNALKDEPHIGYINVDVVGVGSSGFDSLKAIPAYAAITNPINAGASSDYIVYTTVNGKELPLYAMSNIRAEYHWRLREALDPEHGDNIALPPGNELVADLCAARFKLLAGSKTEPPKVQIELKEKIKERIGRSPDEGEAVMLANLRPPVAPIPAAAEVEIDESVYKPSRRR